MKKTLGRGLQSLIPKKQTRINQTSKGGYGVDLANSQKDSIFNIEIDKIRPNPDQPRKTLSEDSLRELSDSIKEHGVLQPLIVTKIEKMTDRGQDVEYELIAGERRWRASRLAGLPNVPVIVRGTSARKKLEIALVENIQRENLNAMETAMAFKQLQTDFGLRHKDIAEKVGKKRTTITNALRLFSLPKEVQKAIIESRITEGHGRAVLLAKPSSQMSVFKEILRKNLSVRQTEEKARKVASLDKPRSHGPKNLVFKKMERNLGEVLGRRVSITQRGDLGHLRIEFSNKKELNEMIDYLLKI